MTIHISKKNSKLGNIPSFSTTPVVGCGKNCYVCSKECYALKSYRMYPTVRTAWNDNLALLEFNEFDVVYGAIVNYCRRHKTRFFRWFASGDIYNADTLQCIVDIANATPNTKHYCYTKQYDIVNDYLDNHDLPSNLTIIFSLWRGLPCDNRHNLPTFECIEELTNEDQRQRLCVNQLNKKITCDRCPRHCADMQCGYSKYVVKH